MSSLPLSVLDLVPLGSGSTSAASLAASLELARAAERLGYQRVWYAEHHNMPGIATTAPEILIAHIAAATEKIRVGSGGVMLPNHAPLKIAETYRLLEALHPGRVDLGIGRAPGTDMTTALALRRSAQALGADDFDTQLAELRAFAAGTLPAGHPFRAIRAMPDDVPLPPIWLLGSSDYSARLAARLGLGFAFAGHFSPDPAEGPMRLYRESFRPGPLERPHAILALAVFCADEERTAERMALSVQATFLDLRTGRPGRLLSPEECEQRRYSPEERFAMDHYKRGQIIGTPERVRERIDAMVELTSADEIMVATHAHDPGLRLRSYELVAEAYRP